MSKVIVGLSGGVDSSVAALLLKKEGYEVVGLFMKNWEEEPCSATQDYADALAVAETLSIPLYSVTFSKEYWDKVFAICLEQYQRGITPNPDILCNQEIKFSVFVEKALKMGGDFIATGHYCRKGMHRGNWVLHKAIDKEKDQSYFLYAIPPVLDKILFPLGKLHKSQVRELAQRHHFVTANKKDSTGICFIGKRDFKTFLQRYIPIHKGEIITQEGNVIGEHEGIAYYTIGQRRGLSLGGLSEPYFVIGKEVQTNRLIVGPQNALYRKECKIDHVHWFVPYQGQCTCKIRYRSPDVACYIEGTTVTFDQPQLAVTPGQSIVFYQDTLCLGGGIIER